MSIHDEHPFLAAEPDRDPARRLRGRLGGAVSLWTAGDGAERAGLTVSSLLVSPGEPARVLALLDPDADLTDALRGTGTAVVQLLRWPHRGLAEAFAGLSPAPGGPFRAAVWETTAWGPRLADAPTWAGVRLEAAHEVGWALQVVCAVEHVEVGPDDDPLEHRRGRWLRPAAPAGRPADQ